MKLKTIRGRLLLATVLTLGAARSASAQTDTPQRMENIVTQRATGSFDVKLTPQPVHDGVDAVVGRNSIAKQFHGALAGTSAGEMLGYWSNDTNSGAYVAIERFTGTLGGRSGSFLLVHKGVMDAGGGPPLDITVAPNSGSGELTGIAGSMNIIMEGGRHDYVFEYTLPARETESR
jgi:hypothetical protein